MTPQAEENTFCHSDSVKECCEKQNLDAGIDKIVYQENLKSVGARFSVIIPGTVLLIILIMYAFFCLKRRGYSRCCHPTTTTEAKEGGSLSEVRVEEEESSVDKLRSKIVENSK